MNSVLLYLVGKKICSWRKYLLSVDNCKALTQTLIWDLHLMCWLRFWPGLSYERFWFHHCRKMQDFRIQDSDLSSAQSMAPHVAKYASWWNSSGSQIEQSFVSKNLSLNITPNQLGQNVKQMVFQFQDRDSSSTQSTSQSYHEAASVGSIISSQSGNQWHSLPLLIYGFENNGKFRCYPEVDESRGKE